MATILRGPLYVNRRNSQDIPAPSPVPNLLLSTLLVVAALPFNNAGAFTSPQPRPAIGADTSQSTPKTLFADAASPFFNPTVCAPRLERHPVDTSQGSPLSLLSAVQAPFVTASLPQTPRREWAAPNTSQSTPKTLFADSVSPFSNSTTAAPSGARQLADTSRGSPLSLLAAAGAVQAPFVHAPLLQTPRREWLPANTSQSTPKTLYADGVAPFFNPPFLRVSPLPQVFDTSRGVRPDILLFDPGKPFAQTDWQAPIRTPVRPFASSYGPNPNLFTPPAPGGTTNAVLYLTLRTVSGRYAQSGIPSAANQRNKRPGYPGAHVPLGRIEKDAAGNMRVLIASQWDTYLSFEHEQRLGGLTENTLPEVKDSITYGQAQALIQEAVNAAITQQANANAQVIDALKQVAVNAALPGSDQVPPVQLTPESTGGD